MVDSLQVAEVVGTKKCSSCRLIVNLGAFTRNRAHSEGLDNQCVPCKRQTRRLHKRDRHLRAFHTTCEVCGASESQNGGRGGKTLHVDHSPSGLFRGVLCDVCNKTLSREMTSERLRALADYLETRTD